MRNLRLLLQREPAALGSLVASILPVLVLLDVIRIDEAGIAAVVVAINTAVGFGVRVLVSPNSPSARRKRLARPVAGSPARRRRRYAPSASRPSRHAVRASGSAPPRSAAQRSDSRPCSSRADAVAARSSAGSYGSQRAERSRVGWDASWRVAECFASRTGAAGEATPCSLIQAISAPTARAISSPWSRSPLQTDSVPSVARASAIASSSVAASWIASTGPGTGSCSSSASGGTSQSTTGA